LSSREREIIEHISEYLRVMEDEPADALIKLKTVYHDIRRILDEDYIYKNPIKENV